MKWASKEELWGWVYTFSEAKYATRNNKQIPDELAERLEKAVEVLEAVQQEIDDYQPSDTVIEK